MNSGESGSETAQNILQQPACTESSLGLFSTTCVKARMFVLLCLNEASSGGTEGVNLLTLSPKQAKLQSP